MAENERSSNNNKELVEMMAEQKQKNLQRWR